MTGAVDSAAPREQPTTQNQCSCRFKWTKIGEWEAGNEEEVEKKVRDKSKNGREKRGGGTLGAWGRKKNEGWELNQLQVREGRTSRNKKGDPSISSHLKGKKGWRWVHQFASEGLGKRKGERLFFFFFIPPPCGWVEQEALIRHVRAEVILDVSHTPAGQLVLGQVQAEAAQLENCGLGFRSL